MKAFWKQFYRDNFEVFEERDYSVKTQLVYQVYRGHKRRKLIRTDHVALMGRR